MKMKKLFPGYFKPDEGQIKKDWSNSIFVFDANILLNLYRYSDKSREEILRIFMKIKDDSWLPHRVVEEYLENRLTVIYEQETAYNDTSKSVKQLKSDLDNVRKHPFVSEKILKQINTNFEALDKELCKNKTIHTSRINSDDIKDNILLIFNDCVGDPFIKKDIDEILLNGEIRYEEKIPPGYKDAGKSGNSNTFKDKCRKFGDLIIWEQILLMSKESSKGVIFVTDDQKEDWWEIFKGKTIGPRPELVKEFLDKTKQTFHMYQFDRFLELAQTNLGENISSDIVDETRELRLNNKNYYKNISDSVNYSEFKKGLMSFGEFYKARNNIGNDENEESLNKKLSQLEINFKKLSKLKSELPSFEENGVKHRILEAEIQKVMNEYVIVRDLLGKIK